MSRTLLFALSLALLATPSSAQEVTATIVGNVVDPSGAALVGATAQVISIDRNAVVRELKTDSDGGFVATLLPIGRYSVKVEARGFKPVNQTDITLHVSDKITLTFNMALGDVTQVVEVEASAVNVELQSPVSAGLVSGQEVRELALNNRNYIQLINLMPGVTNNSATDEPYIGTTNPLGGTNTIPFAISGGRTSGNNFMVDGADNVDRGSNLTLMVYPSVDAIAEFKALRGQYSAEFGRGATGQINVITKSGGSQYHGNAYEFWRNDVLAANNFFNNLRNIPRPPLRYNDFGYTIGGPVPFIGKKDSDKNKLYFFWSNEFRRVITYSTFQALMPTQDMKNGIFPQPVCVERAGTICTRMDTRITAISPAAQSYLKDIYSKMPAGDPATFFLFTPQKSIYNADQYLIKFDYVLNASNQFSVRYVYDKIPTQEPGGLFTSNPMPGVATTVTDSPGKNWTVRWTSSITPTIYNEAGFSYSYGAIVSNPVGLMASANSPDIKIKLPFPSTLDRVPTLSIASLSGPSGFGPYEDYNRNYNFFDNLSKIVGKHTLKAGVSVNFYQKTENAAGNNAGTFTFANTPRPTGTTPAYQSWANFLLGDVSTFTQASMDLYPDVRQRQWEVYFQDDWRATRYLTLNFGVRLSNFYAPYDANNMLTNFDASLWSKSKAPQVNPANGNIIPGTGDPLNGVIINNTPGNPYGSKVSNEDLWHWAPRVGFALDPFRKGKTAIRGGFGMSYDSPLVGIYEQNIFSNPPYVDNVTISNTRFEDPSVGVPVISAAPKTLRGTPNPMSLPYVAQWSLDIQHQITSKSVLSVGYYGSKGTHLLGIVDMNMVYPGAAVAAGITTPEAPINSATTPRLNALRPYQGYGPINQVQNWFNSNYNALQVNFQQTFGKGGSVRGAYTFAKNLTDASSDRSDSPQNTYARFLEYARSSFDRTHVATFSYIYPIPFGRNLTGFKGGLLKGWQVSGITTFNSGLPLAVTSGLGLDWGGLGILGTSASSPRTNMVLDPNEGAARDRFQWFNTAAFQAPAPGVVAPGNAPRRYMVGPGFSRWDLSVFKTFRIAERYGFQFRWEMFNMPNHTNFQGVGVSVGTTTFGQITSTRDPRRIQVAAKLSF